MELNQGQQDLYSQKVMDLGNLAIGVLVFGMVVSPKGMNWWIFGAGVVIYVLAWTYSYVLTKALGG